MSGFFGGFWNKAVSGQTGATVPEIYGFSLSQDKFVRADIKATYRKILIDTLERTHGILDSIQKHLWDNHVLSESPDGLITLLVNAMYAKSDVCIYYSKAVDVMRIATPAEAEKIKADYKEKGSSDIGACLSFKNFDLTDLLKIFSEMEYCVLRGLNKTVNLSRAIQIKIEDLRKTVSLGDSPIAVTQARSIARGLSEGSDVLLSAGDSIESSTTDTGPIEKSIAFLDQKRSRYLGLPVSYVTGVQTGGIGSTGEGDNRAIERGLKAFYFSIVGPALSAIFGIETSFRSSDFREIDSALEVLRTFELVSDTVISREAKDEIVAIMFDLDPEKEKKAKERELRESSRRPQLTQEIDDDGQ